jgi:signal transduction histidine kinase
MARSRPAFRDSWKALAMHTQTGLIKTIVNARPGLLLGALLSSAIGLLFYVVAAKTIESDSSARFRSMARGAQYTISGRIKSYTDLLRGSASLFQANRYLSREQFHRYVEGLELETYFPGIETINFARYVSDEERPAFERQMHEQLTAAIDREYPPFHITPPGRRSGYTVLTYIEPISAWADKFGLDLQARSVVARTLAHSRDTGEVATSGTRVAILSGPNRHGLGMRLPIYRSDMPIGSVEQRRAAYIGSVGIGFGVHKLVLGVLDEMPVKGARLTISDLSPVPAEPNEGVPRVVLYDSDATDADPTPPIGKADAINFHTAMPIAFNQRTWRADFSVPKRALYTRFDLYFPWLAMVAGFVTSALLYALFQTLASSRQRAIEMAKGMTQELRASQAKLQASHQNLLRLAAHSDQIKEGERKRIAREIHDDLGQNLLALRIEADQLASRTRERHPRLHARARATLHQIDATIKSVRQIINDLRPNVLDLGLNAAVDWQVADFQRRTGIVCELIENETELRIDDRCATAFFRILQESLSNIARHAGATTARIELQLLDNRLSMSVSDNGVGLHPEGRNKIGSFGLVGIEERVSILGGTFSIRGVPGAGTTVVVSVPLHGDPASAAPARQLPFAATPVII